MRLVDSHKTNSATDVLDLLDECLVVQTLGGAVQDPQVAAHHLVVDGLDFLPGLGRVDAVGGDAAPSQGVDLILHQGDERGDDESDAVAA